MSADERWPGRVPLLPDESFSSWFARTAVANGLRPNELFRIVLPGGDRSLRDFDRHADIHLLQHLAEKTGIDAEKLAQSTFRRWGGLVFEHDDGLNKLPWLAPSGRIGGKICYGQQLCPMCLAADAKPYLRLTWRLGFVTVCGLHGNLLLDRCPHCHEPFSVLRQAGRTSIHCAGCGRDVRDFAVEPPLVDNADLQRDFLETARQGWWQLGGYGPVYSFAAFHIFSIIARLLAGGWHAYALRAWVADHETGLSFPPEIVPRARDGERLNVQARNLLVAMADWLMGEWPERFVAAARAAKLTARDIFKHDEDLYPFAFADAVGEWLEASLKRDSREEVASAKMILDRQGKPSTRRNLAELIGSRRRVLSEYAEPAGDGAAWGHGRYWKLDGVSSEVKEAARLAAHHAGEGVGPWLDALLRKQFSMPARKSPQNRRNADTFPHDGVFG